MRPDTRILIVEDDGHALAGYVEYLSDAGYEVVGVADARSALQVAMREGPKVVVTDITLPGMSGFDLATALREEARMHDVPVIGLTANWTREIHQRAAAAQMCAVLRKPCVPSHLVAELERVLSERHS